MCEKCNELTSSYYPPIEVEDDVYNLNPSENIWDRNNPQPWSGYDPEFKIPDQAEYKSQTENIVANDVYDNIEIKMDKWIKMACDFAHESVSKKGGGPFGAIIIQLDGTAPEDGKYENRKIIRYWKNHNWVVQKNDPTAHAEVSIIRNACNDLGVFDLGEIKAEESKLPQSSETSHCIIYSSCEPCPMCYSSISWARIKTLLFGATRFDAAVPGVEFSDEAIYDDLKQSYAERDMTILRCVTDNSLDSFNYFKRNPITKY